MMVEDPVKLQSFQQALEWCHGLDLALWIDVGGRVVRRGGVLCESGPALLLITGERIGAVIEQCILPRDWPDALRRNFPRSAGASFPSSIAAPGLLEGHAHLFLEPDSKAELNEADLLIRAKRNAMSAAAAGVCWIRDCGDPFGINLRLRHQLESDASGAPRLRACGAGIHRRKRYGKQLARAVDDDAGLLAEVRNRIASGVDDIKIMLSGIVNFERQEVPGEPQFSQDALNSAVQLAHDNGRRVVVHASGDKAVRVAALANVDSIEHAYFVSDATLEIIAANAIAWLPTLAPVYVQWRGHTQYGHSEQVRQSLDRILKGHACSIARAAEMGVRVVAGSDSGSPGVPHGAGAVLEFQLLAAHGLGVAQAYSSASCIGAEHVGFEPHPGLESGAAADFVIVPRSPLHDASAFDVLDAVVLRGKFMAAAPAEAGS